MAGTPKDHILTRRGLKWESVISASILVLLAAIAVLIYFQQFSYDKEKFRTVAIQPGTAVSQNILKDEAPLSDLTPENFLPLSDIEHFHPDTLSDKIDGKADLYLEAGFSELYAARFSHSSDPRLWFEFFLYDMQTPINAFSVYSTQKRPGVTPLDITRFAYATDNAVFFINGPYYAEIIAAEKHDLLLTAMTKMSADFIHRHAADGLELAELSYFPEESMVPGSISMILHNGFGFEKFDNIFTGTYQIQGKRLTAFLSVRKTPLEADSLARDYMSFLTDLTENETLPLKTPNIPGLQVMDVFGEYEMVFSKGHILAGVHGSPERLAGEALALRLYNNIAGQP